MFGHWSSTILLWSPALKTDIDRIERVQRRFTKRLPGLNKFSYAERLQFLNLESLELRRLHLDLITCYKIIFGLIDIKSEEFLQRSTSTRTRRHPYKLYKQRSSKSARNSFFCQRVINIWNSLPANIVNFSSINTFKTTITQVDFTVFLKLSN